MAKSSCPRCAGAEFELVVEHPTNAPLPVELVQCAGCGCVVGVLEGLSLSAELRALKSEVAAIAHKLRA